jgi:hypothetical protein
MRSAIWRTSAAASSLSRVRPNLLIEARSRHFAFVPGRWRQR